VLRGNYNDLPNLIWFPEACDPIENWINFFTDPESRILDYRNVWLVNPRNFGNSDRNDSFDIEELANDVARFMYEHKISTATLGGHGFGGKLALAAACYHHTRITGVINVDTAPLDHRQFESFKEFRHYI
jgi:pimeloyl-ACP methyl ester carboxylesterase